MGILHGNQNMVIGGLVLYLDSVNPNSWPPGSATGVISAGQTSYTTPGNYEFEVPEGITQISVLCIGGGGAGGGYSMFAQGGGGGGGGGLAYGTISVGSGSNFEVAVGAGGECPEADSAGGDGGNSQFISDGLTLIQGGGGAGGDAGATGGEGGVGGNSTGIQRDGGGTGGAGGDEDGNDDGGGGGGAGGYEGNGGTGGTTGADDEGADGSGGGGGGGGNGNREGGGGVGFLGEHSPWDEGSGGNAAGGPGSGGSGQTYGGGGGGANKANGSAGEDGGGGAVRIVYKKDDNTRVYPLKSNADDTTYSTGDTTWKYVVSNGIEVDQYSTLKGNVSFSNDVFDFNGTDGYVELSGTSSLNYPITTNVTLSVFVKFDAVGALKGLLTKNRSTSTQLGLWLDASSKLSFSANGSDLAGSTSLTTGTWYNLVGVQLSSISRKVYINGVLDGTKTSSFGTTPSGSENWMIGQATGVTEFLDGQIANATIYNKALTAAEVLQNYNAHKGRFGL